MELALRGVRARHPAAARGTTVLDGIDLAVGAGERVALIGPSGAGKTTLLQIAAAALRPAEGTVSIAGTDPWTLPTRGLQQLRGTLVLAPQVPPLPPRQRVVTAVLAGRLPGWSLATSLRSLLHPTDLVGAHAALARFDLGEKLFDRVDRLSGGERQRVGLARVLVAPARLWLVDEPLSALDPARADQAIDALVGTARERGVTLVATMHQVETALARFDRIVGLRDGRIAFDLPAAEVGRDRLLRLYARHETELDGASPAPPAADGPPPRPRAIHC